MMIKKQNYLKHAIVLFLLLLLMQPERAWAAYENVEFSSLTNHDGLTNSQVGAILKDTRGYIWFGTQSGLCRFDGFRMKTFYYSNTDDKSLPNNSVDELQQDYDGNIWCIPLWGTASTNMMKSSLTANRKNGSKTSMCRDLLTNS